MVMFCLVLEIIVLKFDHKKKHKKFQNACHKTNIFALRVIIM